VTSSVANLRLSPNKDATISWIVGKNMPLRQIKREGAWIQVSDVDNQVHWVHGSSVSSNVNCLVIRSAYTRLRQGPGKGYEVAPMVVADKYTPFRDLGGEDGWTLVEDDQGNRGWIDLKYTWKPTEYVRINLSP
jgi:SH3-like domain-containing protein